MSDKLYVATKNWQQDYPELLEFMQPFIDEWERIVIESSSYKEANEIIERIKNGNDC
jgi:hypothetical protein